MAETVSSYPEAEPNEKVQQLVLSLMKGIVGGLPLGGSVIVELFNCLFKEPLEKRRERWFNDLANAINELTDKYGDISIHTLANNEEFLTILFRASDIALRTHQAEKRMLLRNALVCAGSPTPPELDKQLFFLRLIDELSINQILVLQLYSDPIGWFKSRNQQPNKYYAATPLEVLNQAYPEIGQSPYVRELIVNGLERYGLLSGLGVMVSEDVVYSPKVSKLGREFITYVNAHDLEVKQT